MVFFFLERKRQSKRKMAGIVCPPPFPLLPAFLFLFLKTRLFRCIVPFFFSSKKQKKEKIKEKIENILFFIFLFLPFKERKKSERRARQGRLFHFFFRHSFFSQKKTFGRKFGMLRGRGRLGRKEGKDNDKCVIDRRFHRERAYIKEGCHE